MALRNNDFLYQPLNIAERQIRLVTLQPGKFHHEIVCNIYMVSLDRNPSYEALSYVWGDPRITQSIQVDGMPFDITLNLVAALRRLRYSNNYRRLWVDAICINQGDLDERSSQVAIMSGIYKQTEGAILWVGDDLDYPLKKVDDCQSFKSVPHLFAESNFRQLM
jgi:Heterokaryon incompatibility protein (HET)